MAPSSTEPGREPSRRAGLAVPPVNPRRLAFLGTPAAAVPCLRVLLDAGLDVALVVTRADARRGRRGSPSPSPVKVAALEAGLPVAHDPEAVAAAAVDLGVVVAYGRILRRDLLERVPMVNVHFSLLPRWRGAAPVERAILAGDERTGVAVMAVDAELDTGDVYAERATAIGGDESADSLRARLATMGADLLVETLRAGLHAPRAQAGEVTYAAKITPEDLHIDWTAPTEHILRQVRVGGAWTSIEGRRLKILAARPAPGTAAGPPGAIDGCIVATGTGALELLEVQAEGRGRQPADAWARGARLAPGARLGG